MVVDIFLCAVSVWRAFLSSLIRRAICSVLVPYVDVDGGDLVATYPCVSDLVYATVCDVSGVKRCSMDVSACVLNTCLEGK